MSDTIKRAQNRPIFNAQNGAEGAERGLIAAQVEGRTNRKRGKTGLTDGWTGGVTGCAGPGRRQGDRRGLAGVVRGRARVTCPACCRGLFGGIVGPVQDSGSGVAPDGRFFGLRFRVVCPLLFFVLYSG